MEYDQVRRDLSYCSLNVQEPYTLVHSSTCTTTNSIYTYRCHVSATSRCIDPVLWPHKDALWALSARIQLVVHEIVIIGHTHWLHVRGKNELCMTNLYGTIQIVAAALNGFIFGTFLPTIRTDNTDQLLVSLLAH